MSGAAVDLEFCRALPKAELHAHLNGSVRTDLLRRLAAARNEPLKESEIQVLESDSRTLSECFELFGIIHRLVSDLSALREVTRSVIADFASDGLHPLRLRFSCSNCTQQSDHEHACAMQV
eukprot:m.209751 g.209751  ORF g.209751 m.209751 type:complete len:121 (-) comp10730_c0_seq3:2345-2707(-)